MRVGQNEISRRGFLGKAGAAVATAASAKEIFARDPARVSAPETGKERGGGKRNWKESLALAMDFIGRAYITDRKHPDYHGLFHMYDPRAGGWNYAYMELAWQAAYAALLPYYDYSGQQRWLRQAIDMIVDWGIPVVMCHDPKSPAYGGMRLNSLPTSHKDTGLYANRYHTFDTGDGLLAFLMVHQRTGDARIADGIKLVSSFLRRATTDKGQMRTCFDVKQGRWSDDLTIYANSRGAWPYAYWYSLTGREEYKKWAVDYCRWTLQHQRANGYLSHQELEVAEFMMYAVEGLYWTGKYCNVPRLIERAKVTFDALVRAEKVWPGNCFLRYRADWRPHDADKRAGPDDGERDLLSACGQYARLAHYFWKSTGEDRYRREYDDTLKAMYDAQDRTSDDPHLRGGWPRASNHPWQREVCPAYNYVGALLLDSTHCQRYNGGVSCG